MDATADRQADPPPTTARACDRGQGPSSLGIRVAHIHTHTHPQARRALAQVVPVNLGWSQVGASRQRRQRHVAGLAALRHRQLTGGLFPGRCGGRAG